MQNGEEMKKLLMYVNSMNALGGIERVIANLANRFISYYEVTILVKDKPISVYSLDDRIRMESVECELKMDMSSRLKRIVSVPVNIIKSRHQLKSYFRMHSYDYIYTALPTNGIEVYLADKSYRNRIVASEHASYYAYNGVYRRMKEWLYPRLKVISVPTSMDTEIYRKLGYNAVHIPHIAAQCATYENKLNSKRIINVGRLTSDKQQSVLLDIWKIVNEKLPDNEWKLQIIGSGEEESSLKEKIARENIRNVEMIPHTLNINEYYKDAELFVFTSKMEGFGMVLLEAMAFGVPCISFDCPSGPRDIIIQKKNGFLIKCYDKESFASHIYKYIKMTYEEKKMMSDNAVETIKKWNDQELIKQWIEVFGELEKNKNR